MAEVTQEWRKPLIGVEHSFAQIAEAAGLTTDTVTKIVTGKTANPGVLTVRRLENALDRLRGTCPHCGQKLPPKGPRNAVVRGKKSHQAAKA